MVKASISFVVLRLLFPFFERLFLGMKRNWDFFFLCYWEEAVGRLPRTIDYTLEYVYGYECY